MPSQREIRIRIGSVKNIQQITRAMQFVAASKLKRAQDQAESARPYAQKMASVIANLAAGVSGSDAPRLLAGTGGDQRHLIVVATADKGLAGGFSTNVIRAARELGIDAGRDQRVVLQVVDLAAVRLGHPRVTDLRCHIYVRSRDGAALPVDQSR